MWFIASMNTTIACLPLLRSKHCKEEKEKKRMTKIILAFPCMGKTYYAERHPNIALDLESSDFLFDRIGYEHLSSEEFNKKPA